MLSVFYTLTGSTFSSCSMTFTSDLSETSSFTYWGLGDSSTFISFSGGWSGSVEISSIEQICSALTCTGCDSYSETGADDVISTSLFFYSKARLSFLVIRMTFSFGFSRLTSTIIGSLTVSTWVCSFFNLVVVSKFIGWSSVTFVEAPLVLSSLISSSTT